MKQQYAVYRVRTEYDDCGMVIRTSREYVGRTYAASPKQAANNVRYREKAGLSKVFYDGYGDSSIVRTYEAILA